MSQNDDLISRQAAIDALAKFVPYAICDESTESYTNGLTDAYNLILQLPSAQPERKVGRWILHPEWEIDGECSATCSECEMGVDVLYNFCPRCGAKMERRTDG